MASEEEIQNAILGTIYDASTEENNSLISTVITRSSLIESVDEQLDEVGENEVEYELTALEEDWLIKRDKSTLQMGWRGLERYQELGGDTGLDESFQEELLELLLEAKKENPRRAYVEKQSLMEELGTEEEILTENVFVLREVGHVELGQSLGDDYDSVQITSSGRKALNRRSQTAWGLEGAIADAVGEELNSGDLVEVEAASASQSVEHDAFICHASEDKDSFVRPLANELTDRGLDVWYDEFQLEVGDSIRESIDRGLSNSRYGIVVMSEHFFEKNWTQYELNGLTAKEMESGKVVLPVWYNIGKDEVMEYSPPLADKMAVPATDDSVSETAEKLESAIN